MLLARTRLSLEGPAFGRTLMEFLFGWVTLPSSLYGLESTLSRIRFAFSAVGAEFDRFGFRLSHTGQRYNFLLRVAFVAAIFYLAH